MGLVGVERGGLLGGDGRGSLLGRVIITYVVVVIFRTGVWTVNILGTTCIVI